MKSRSLNDEGSGEGTTRPTSKLRTLSEPVMRILPWRAVWISASLLLAIGALGIGYAFWRPGLDIRDGRHDRGRNGLWLSHGWLGADQWYIRYRKTSEISRYRDPDKIRQLADKLRRHHVTDVFPHLCPADPDGRLPAVDSAQVERFLDRFQGVRVLPWIGGPNKGSANLGNSAWRSVFTHEVNRLLVSHPRLAGVQLNLEPLQSGDGEFLKLLEELRLALPPGKLLSVAAYPPPTRWHPFPEVHWDEAYFRAVARRCDQLAVMMYDAGQRIPKTYQLLVADWTEEVLAWSEGKSVLLGVPTYDDADVGYHSPQVENLTNALLGVHRGLSRHSLPTNYQGVAIYCDWETSDEQWAFFQEHFLNRNGFVR